MSAGIPTDIRLIRSGITKQRSAFSRYVTQKKGGESPKRVASDGQGASYVPSGRSTPEVAHRSGARFPDIGRQDKWFLLAFALSATVLPLLYLDQPLHFDEGIFLTIGQQIAAGQTLYADIADHKPPGIFLLAAGIYKVTETSMVAARLLTYSVTAVSGLLVVRLGQQFADRRAAQGAGVLFVVMSYLPHFDGYYFLTEPFATLTLLVAAVLLGRGTRKSNAGAGVALAVGVLFNQTVFLFGATVILWHLVRLRYPDNRTRDYVVTSVWDILTVGVGFLVAIGAALAALGSQGLIDETVYYAFVLPFENYNTPFELWGHILALGTLLPVWLLASGTLLVTSIEVARGKRVDNGFLFVALWAGVLSIPGATAFSGDHKFLFAFPAIALITATSLLRLTELGEWSRDHLFGTRPNRSALLAGLLLAVVLTTTLVAGVGNAEYASNQLENDIADDRAAISAAVAGLDGPMYGYNVESDLYVHSDTEPGTTYLGTIYVDGIARDKIRDLERDEVRYVVVKDNYVSDGKIVSSGYWTEHKSKMTAYLNENYEPMRRTDSYLIFERIDS